MTSSAAVSDRDFARFQALIRDEAGIFLAPAKKALLQGRLARRVRELGVPSFGAYYELVARDDAERTRMLDAVCTNETHFFREPRHFEHLVRSVLPALRADADAGRRPRQVHVWSAACSTGEEPYSLAMTLLAALPPGWDVRILATDLSTRVLACAVEGLYPLEKAEEIPEPYLKAFMLRGHGAREGLMKAGPEIRALVRFERMNLASPAWPALGPFDAVFLRNVLIYFDRETKAGVAWRALSTLAPGGQLFLGHAESLAGLPIRFRAVQPTIYAIYASEAARRAEEAAT
ncbi:MAG TPA: protein-glutamate O-methyltransferase [Anaeromyxobacter sp.]